MRVAVPKRGRHPKRRGVATIVVIAFFAVSTVLLTAWVRTTLDHQKQTRQWRHRAQAAWLAEAGLRRAAARLAGDEGYTGEQWKIAASELGGTHGAEVVISVVPPGEDASGPVRIKAVATYPVGARLSTQVTRTTPTAPVGNP